MQVGAQTEDKVEFDVWTLLSEAAQERLAEVTLCGREQSETFARQFGRRRGRTGRDHLERAQARFHFNAQQSSHKPGFLYNRVAGEDRLTARQLADRGQFVDRLQHVEESPRLLLGMCALGAASKLVP